MDKNNKKISILLLTIAVIIGGTLLYCFLLSKNLVRPGGFSPEWTWGHRELDANSLPNLKTVYQAGLFAIAFVSLSWFVFSKARKVAVYIIIPLAILISFYIYIAVTVESNYNFHSIPIMIVNESIVGPFQDATKIENPIFLFTEYEKIQTSLTGQSHTHPPGNILFFRLFIFLATKSVAIGKLAVWLSDQLHVNRDYLASIDVFLRNPSFYRASILSGLFLPLLSFLSAIPTYAIAKVLFSNKVGLIAALLSLSVPSYILISPQLDQLFVLLAMSFLAIYLLAIQKSNRAAAILAGLFFVFSFFFTIAMSLMLPIVFLLTAILKFPKAGTNLRKDVIISLRKTVGEKVLWYTIATILVAFFSLSLLKINIALIINAILQINSNYNRGSHGIVHSYRYWIFNNLYDFFFFLGIPVTLLSMLQMFSGKNSDFRRTGQIFAVSVFLFVLLLSLLGINRGEVARLWMFLMPLFIIAASVAIHDLGKQSVGATAFLLAIVTGMQIYQTTAFRMYMNIYNLVTLPFFHYPVTSSDFFLLHFLFP